MILQTDNPIRMVRELKGAPLSIWMVLSLVHQRVTQEYLERATGYTDKPVSQALAYLQEIGLADHSNAGWQLVKETAKQLPLTLRIDEGEEQEKEQIAMSDENQEHPPRNDNNLGRNNSDSLNYLNTVVVEDLLINNTSSTTDLNLSDKSAPHGEIPTLEEIQQVLDAAEDLFGHSIMGDPRDYVDIDRLVSWIAKSYAGFKKSDKSKIYNPAGMVYWAFHKGKDVQPEKKYLDISNYDQLFEWDRKFETFMINAGLWNEEDEDG